MSGPLAPQVASAAQRLAHVARARALIAGHRRAKDSESLPGKTWAAIPKRTRWLLVTMATLRESADQAALLPWESFSDAEQAQLAACAREIARDLRDCASLF